MTEVEGLFSFVGMKQTTTDIFNDIKPSEIILYQTFSNWDKVNGYKTISKLKIGTIVAVDIWDMAFVVGVVDLCRFDCSFHSNSQEMLEIEWLEDWTEKHVIVGRWSTVPTVTEVKTAIRNYSKES